MSEGEIKSGKENSKQIPLVKPVWFVVFSIEDGKIKERTFSTTKVQKKALFKFLVLSGCEKVYGVWNGQWNTNLFDMDINILKKRLAQDLQMTITEMKEEVLKEIKFLISVDLTPIEIADNIGISVSTLKKRLTEAGVELQRGAKVLK